MAHPLQAFSVVEVAKPKIGENHPARVRADVTVNLNLRPEIKAEWENLRKHDVAFLITVRPINPIGSYCRVSLISSNCFICPCVYTQTCYISKDLHSKYYFVELRVVSHNVDTVSKYLYT